MCFNTLATIHPFDEKIPAWGGFACEGNFWSGNLEKGADPRQIPIAHPESEAENVWSANPLVNDIGESVRVNCEQSPEDNTCKPQTETCDKANAGCFLAHKYDGDMQCKTFTNQTTHHLIADGGCRSYPFASTGEPELYTAECDSEGKAIKIHHCMSHTKTSLDFHWLFTNIFNSYWWLVI
jgi:hypothetical protein